MLSLITHSMTAGPFGVFALWFNTVLFLVVMAGCGQEKLIIRSWNEHLSAGAFDLAKGALQFGWAVSIAGVAVVSGLLGAVGLLTGQSFRLVASAAILLALQTLYKYSSHVSRAVVGIFPADVHDITWRVVVGVGALMAGLVLDPASVLLLACAGTIVAITAQLFSVRAHLPERVATATPAFQGKVWSKRSLAMASAAVLEAASEFLEVVLIGVALSPEVAGGYFVAARLANVFAMISGGLHSFASRQIARQHFTEGKAALRETLRKLAVITVVLVISTGALFAVGGTWFLSLFGAAFVAHHPVLLLLSVGTAFVTLAGPAPAVLLSTGHEGTYSKVIAFGVTSRLGLVLIFALGSGAVAAATASAIVAILTAVSLNVACRRLVGVDPAITALVTDPG